MRSFLLRSLSRRRRRWPTHPFKYDNAQRDACLPDVRKYCKDVKPPKGADEMTVQTMYQACLNQHRDNARPDHLSQKCLDLFTQYGR